MEESLNQKDKKEEREEKDKWQERDASITR